MKFLEGRTNKLKTFSSEGKVTSFWKEVLSTTLSVLSLSQVVTFKLLEKDSFALLQNFGPYHTAHWLIRLIRKSVEVEAKRR